MSAFTTASDKALWERYDMDVDECHTQTMLDMQEEGFDTDRLIELMRALTCPSIE